MYIILSFAVYYLFHISVASFNRDVVIPLHATRPGGQKIRNKMHSIGFLIGNWRVVLKSSQTERKSDRAAYHRASYMREVEH